MRITIVSDIHDHVWHLGVMLRNMPATDALICCGDLCSPFIVNLLAGGYASPIHIVFGNNDGDLFRITRNADRFDHVYLHGEFFETAIDGRQIKVTHYPDIAASLASPGNEGRVVCYGHDHRYAIRREHGVLLLNPGPIMGYDPVAGTDVPATFLIYDTAAHTVRGYRIMRDRVEPYETS